MVQTTEDMAVQKTLEQISSELNIGKITTNLQTLLDTLSKHAAICEQAISDAAREGHYLKQTKVEVVKELREGVFSLQALIESIDDMLWTASIQAHAEDVLRKVTK